MKPLVLDPRSKLVACLVVSSMLMILNAWTGLAVSLGMLLAVTILLGLGRSWLGLLNGLGFASLSFFVIAWFSFDLPTALAAGLRLLTIGTVFFLFFQTTAPEDLSNALVKLGLPYTLTFVLSVSLQFVEVLARRAANIWDAQQARGIPLGRSMTALRHLPALMGPLLVQAFKLADELAEAMEARGFGAPGRRFRCEPRFRAIDWLVILLSASALILAWWPRQP